MLRKRAYLLCIAVFLFGCASIVKKEVTDFKTTGLFTKPCRDLEKAWMEGEKPRKKGFFAAINPANLVKDGPQEKIEKLNTTVNDCVQPDLERMVKNFMSIRETDEEKGILGDTVEEVRKKGFSIFDDAEGRLRRQNTRVLYGDEALAEIGIGIGQSQATTVEEAEKMVRFKKMHYGEQYFEKGLKRIADRLCINNEESLDIGLDYSFVIVWRGKHVFTRVIKGGFVNNPKKESGFLICPGGFIGDTIKGTTGGAIRNLKLGF